MRDIQSAYKNAGLKDQIDFASFRGHVVSLAEPDTYRDDWGNPWRFNVLPMMPTEFKLSTVKGASPLVKELKNKIKEGGYDYLINACDAAREGELIFYNFYESLPKKYQLPVKRFWASDTTEETLKKALNNLIDDNNIDLVNLKNSAKLRARWDWMLGLNMTRLFTLTESTLFIIGRVMTSTLYLVEMRRREIENFKPIDLYELQGTFNKDKISFLGRCIVSEGKVRSTDKKELEKRLKAIKGEDKAQVEKLIKEKKIEHARPCYNLTDLQKDAAFYYKYSPAKTLNIAQSLYEKHKILSYPRTESRFIPRNVAKEIKSLLKEPMKINEFSGYKLEKNKVDDFVNNKRYVDDAKITDHHALLPTKSFKVSDLGKLNEEEKKIFNLVLKRFISLFLKDYEEEKTTIYLKVKDQEFRAVGSVLIEPGFTSLLGYKKVDSLLPKLKEKELIDIKDISIKNFKTKPPLYYTEGTLLEGMEGVGRGLNEKELSTILKETGGLGTPATRAEIIEKLKRYGYIELRKNYIHTTLKGIEIIKVLEPYGLCKPDITAKWEMKLSLVESGKLKETEEMEKFKEYIKTMTEEIMNERDKYKEGMEIGRCPRCGEKVVTGRYGYVCENYRRMDGGPTCDFSVGFEVCGAQISPDEIERMLNGEKIGPKFMTFKSGKTGNPMLYLDNYGKLQFDFDYKNKKVGICPICGKVVNDTGKFYVCDGYKLEEEDPDKCEFILKKVISGTDINEIDIKKLLTEGKTDYKEFLWKSGSKGRARFVIDKKERKATMEFEPRK